jgi:hypothetical protein
VCALRLCIIISECKSTGSIISRVVIIFLRVQRSASLALAEPFF